MTLVVALGLLSSKALIVNEELLKKILTGIAGIDLNPLSVLSARANFLIQVLNLLEGSDLQIRIPIIQGDAILDDIGLAKVDYIVGNPPWISWDLLPREYREETRSLWEYHGLFSLDGRRALYGGSKKDISMLFTYATTEKFLKNNGILAFLMTQTIFKTKGAGDGFRRFQLGSKTPLKVLKVHDLSRINPFQDASSTTSIMFLQKGVSTAYPVPFYRWTTNKGKNSMIRLAATPVDPNSVTSPWLTLAENRLGLKELFGNSIYDAREGVNTGGANGVYWFRILEKTSHAKIRIENDPALGKIPVERVRAQIETKNVFPLIKSKNVKKWALTSSDLYVLVCQDPETRRGFPLVTFQKSSPLQYAYLKRFQERLENRALYKKFFAKINAPFYSMYNVQKETFSPYKVAWSRMSKNLEAALIKPVNDKFLGEIIPIPQETISYVPFNDLEEAFYFCAMINSELSNEFVRAYSVTGGKGFASTHVLQYLKIPKFAPENEIHVELAKQARLLTENESSLKKDDNIEMEKEITRLSARAYKVPELNLSR
ncbi:MAG: Eco57I restriction-modification methylase domain-containing protein [Candidatus Helarchaeota archaeon]